MWGDVTTGYQPIIIPGIGNSERLGVASVGGISVSATPSGLPTTPDVVIPGTFSNPVDVEVICVNIPLNSEIRVIVQPPNGPAVIGTGLNSTGTVSASMATVPVNFPRGGGTLHAVVDAGSN